jgi:hypothetical protein
MPESPYPSQELALQVASLTEAVARLEARVARLEGTCEDILPAAARPPLPDAAQALESGPGSLVAHLALLGQVCLILGGAFFFRSLTDAGTWPKGPGVAIGLAYALAWSLVAWRTRTDLPATFYALASVLITYPLVWESTTTFHTFSSLTAVLVLLAAAIVHVGLAWARSLKVVAWASALAALGTAFALMAATQSLPWFTGLFLAYGAGSLWLTYGRRWHALRWPAALAADLAILVLALLAAWPGGPPEGYRDLTPRLAMGLALALVVIYLGSFAARMLQRRRTLNAFEVVQTFLVLLVGFGGSLRVALVSGNGAGLLGMGVLLAGLGCYGAAFPFAADREDLRANFSFFTSLALVFLLLGGPIVLPAGAFSQAAGALGLASLLLGLHLRRTVLLLQGGLYLVTATVASGLLGWSVPAFIGAQVRILVPTVSGWMLLAFLIVAHALLVARRPPNSLGWRLRLPSLVVGALAVFGLGAAVIWTGMGLVRSVDAGQLAALRTGVLSASAIGLAGLGRRWPESELTWLVYPLLGLSALKFLMEDLSVGRPLTLFPAFMVFGTALILAPRLLKAAPAAAPRGKA